MGNFMKYGATSDGTLAPAPVVYNQVPVSEILAYPNKGWGFYSDAQIATIDAASTDTRQIHFPAVITATAAAATAGNAIINLHSEGGGFTMIAVATENQGIQFQAGEAFIPKIGSKIVMGARVATNDSDQTDFFIGICTTDTTIIAGRPADAIGFSVADESAVLLYNVSKTGGTVAATALTTTTSLVDATYVDLGIVVDELTSVEFFVNGVSKAKITTSIPVVEMGFAIAMLTGEATANTLSVKNFYCWQFEK